MANEPVVITIYGENDEVKGEFKRSIIPWGMLKKALKMKDIKADNIDEKVFDEMGNYVCELFGNKFTLKELDEGADMIEVMAVIKAVVSRATEYFKDPN